MKKILRVENISPDGVFGDLVDSSGFTMLYQGTLSNLEDYTPPGETSGEASGGKLTVKELLKLKEAGFSGTEIMQMKRDGVL